MALDEALGVAAAFRAAAQQQLAHSQQVSQDEDRKARVKEVQDRLDQQKTEFNAQHALAIKAADMVRQLNEYKVLQDKTSIAQHIMGGGAVPGDAQAPVGGNETTGNFSPVGGITDPNTTSVMHQIPMGDGQPPLQMTLPTPNAYATQQANIARITNAPAEEAKTRESVATQSAMTDKLLAGKAADDERVQAAKAQDFLRETQREKAQADLQLQLERMRTASAERINASKNNGSSIDVEPLIQDGVNGNLSQEELNRMAITKQDKAMITNGVLQAGGRLYTQAQKDVIPTFVNAVKTVGNMDEFIANQPQSKNWLAAQIGGLGTAFDSKLNNLQDMIKADTMAIAKTIQGAKGQRIMNLELKLAQGGFVPKRNQTLEENVIRRNQYVQSLQDVVRANLSSLPPESVNATLQRLGILDIPMLDPSTGKPIQRTGGTQSTTTNQTNPAATHVWTPNGIQPIGQQVGH
jgi:hypothetical protein